MKKRELKRSEKRREGPNGPSCKRKLTRDSLKERERGSRGRFIWLCFRVEKQRRKLIRNPDNTSNPYTTHPTHACMMCRNDHEEVAHRNYLSTSWRSLGASTFERPKEEYWRLSTAMAQCRLHEHGRYRSDVTEMRCRLVLADLGIPKLLSSFWL